MDAMSAASAPVWTIKALLNWTTNFLKDKGVDSPRLDAELLLAHALQCKRIDLVMRHDEEPSPAVRSSYRELVRRRSEHWPTAYLVGTREFFLLPFTVSPAVLIPRPDTETLLMAALESVRGLAAPRILDLGTGSGILAVSLAHQLPTAAITAVDISPDAIAIARQNALAHTVESRIDFRTGDLFGPLDPGSRFDRIISNPPYIAASEWASLSPDVRDHEPKLALDGGPDGLAFYRRIMAGAIDFLAPGGQVLVEIGHTQSESVSAIIADTAGLQLHRTVKDAGGRPRVVVAAK
jgi:release factor glutamine methyltransferase